MPKYSYFAANRTAGYSGFVYCENADGSFSYWLIPGTFEDDWDNRFKPDRSAS